MNTQLKTILLTVLTLSLFTIALIELSGVSNEALFNKYGIGNGGHDHNELSETEFNKRMDKMRAMPKTTIKFDDTKHDFGTIVEGEKVSHAYHFVNTGDQPLFISDAKASCGCTIPSFPKEPILPGQDGEIMVEFNSNNRVGMQRKNVLVYSNAQQEAMSIGFVVEVKEK